MATPTNSLEPGSQQQPGEGPQASQEPQAILPRYPIYVPSKGRADVCYTAQRLVKDGTPFYLVVEPQEVDAYAARYGRERILTLPFHDRGSVIYARNWIMDHAIAAGHARHWQLDDNITDFYRRYRGKRVPCLAGIALRVCEDLSDRYENVALSGLNYEMFVPDYSKLKPFVTNSRVYSCTLINHAAGFRWRLTRNEDTDICLQALSAGWCTILLNAFMARKVRTMTVKGGNTAALYQGDGRLQMARDLERVWPGVVTVDRRFQRPQHVVKDSWKKFDTPLKLRADVDLSALGQVNEYGMSLAQVAPTVKSARMRRLQAAWQTSQQQTSQQTSQQQDQEGEASHGADQ